MSSVRSAAPEGHAPTAFASTAMASLLLPFAGALGGALLVVPTLHELRGGLHRHRRVAAIGGGAARFGQGLVQRPAPDPPHVVVRAAPHPTGLAHPPPAGRHRQAAARGRRWTWGVGSG